MQHAETALRRWDPAVLAAHDDDALRLLLADEDDRRQALHVLLGGLNTTGVWTGPVGVVQVQVTLPDSRQDIWTLGFGPFRVALVDAEPQVVVRLPLVPAVRVVTGQADGALLHLGGALEVLGDEQLLLAIGSSLPTAAGRPLVDAAALDPLAVSVAIADVPTEHLAAVMAGGFRDLVLDEVFRRVPEFVITEKAERARVAVAFEVGGRPDGASDRYVVRIVDGDCTVVRGAVDEVDATLVLEGHQFLRLVLGHLNPVRAVLSGELVVRGQLIKALGFNSLVRIPGTAGA